MREIPLRRRACYCTNLRRATNSITKYYDRVFKSTEMTVSQFALMSDLNYLGTCTTAELAYHAKLDSSTITRNLKKMKDKGYIQDLSDNGSRESQISLTPLGKDKMEEGNEVWLKAQDNINQKIDSEKLACLEEALMIIEQL